MNRVSGFGFRVSDRYRSASRHDNRKRITRNAILALCCLLFIAGTAFAREPDGLLGLIRTPNNGVPVITVPDGAFEAVLKEQAVLRLLGEGPPVELNAEWSALPGGGTKARCMVGANTPPGMYSLEANAGGHTDRNVRAVFVRDAFPESYIVAQLTDTHVGSTAARPAKDVFRDAVRAVNESQAAFALITGDVTENGEPDQFREFLEILDTCTIPTFVCPGNHDRQGLNYETVFGTLTYVFRFGPDGYLCFDTKDFIPADDLSSQDNDLEVFRREIRGARWSVGVAHRYEYTMGMRAQLALFVDDPLDLLIFGHWHRANNESEKRVPWGTTSMAVMPATKDGFLRLFDVSLKGIKPREPQRVAATE